MTITGESLMTVIGSSFDDTISAKGGYGTGRAVPAGVAFHVLPTDAGSARRSV